MSKAKVLLVGDYKEFPSEGMEVITKRFVDRLRSNGLNISTITAKSFFLKMFVVLLLRYDKVIFTHGPGKGAYILTLLVSIFFGPQVIWVATRPDISFNGFLDRFLFKLEKIYCGKRDQRLIQLAERCSADFKQVIIGIDFERLEAFNDSNIIKKSELIGECGDVDVPMILHVGHLRKNRGLDRLVEIKKKLGSKVNIVVIGSPSLSSDEDVISYLNANNVNIYREHIPNLSSVYRVSDLYVFPVDPVNGGAIDLPLSVIEALMCGVPVVSTRFGVLPEYFEENPCIMFDNGNLVDIAVEKIESGIDKVIKPSIDILPNEFNIDTLIDEVSGVVLKKNK